MCKENPENLTYPPETVKKLTNRIAVFLRALLPKRRWSRGGLIHGPTKTDWTVVRAEISAGTYSLDGGKTWHKYNTEKLLQPGDMAQIWKPENWKTGP